MNYYRALTPLFILAFYIFLSPLSALNRPADVPDDAIYNGRLKVWILDKANQRTVWHENGRKKALGKFKNKQRDGDWTFWHSTGNLWGQGKFKASRKVGFWRFYFPTGKLKSAGNYESNRRKGPWQFYAPAGFKETELTFTRGQKHGPARSYYKGGKLYYAGSYWNNKESGNWKYYTRSGRLVQAGAFRSGVRVGKWYICVAGQCGYETFKISDIPRRSGHIHGAEPRRKKKKGNEFTDILDKYSTKRRY